MAAHATVHCPLLSTTFTGVRHSLSSPELPIHQFRGIKYASVPARFRCSQPYTSYGGITDAKEHGPTAPQPKSRTDETLFGLPPGQFVIQEPVVQNEFECLNLTITCPGDATSQSSLPVMVWVHGGGNVQGRGNGYITDAGKLVRASMELERPVIVVAINFRLGLLGFGASRALEEDNRLAGDEGVGNYGLHDQLNALFWVHNYIRSFGGDSSNITIFGESSGGIDTHSILLSKSHQNQPVAVRAIMQSGVVRPVAVQTIDSQGSLISRAMSNLGVTTIEGLRAVAIDDLVSHSPRTMSPTDDGVFFRDDWKAQPFPEGIQSLIIGDCMLESVLWDEPVSLWTTSSIIRRVRAIIHGVYKADAFLRVYGLTSSTYDEDAQESALNIINDVHFAWPTDKTARGTKNNSVEVYRYVFDQESPWNFRAHHAVDLLYLFDNVPTGLPSRKSLNLRRENSDSDSDLDSDSDDRFGVSNSAYNFSRVRRAMQGRWIAFANGERPWNSEKLYVFGPEGEIGEREAAELGRRRRLDEWREAFDNTPPDVLHKVAVELSSGPRVALKARF